MRDNWTPIIIQQLIIKGEAELKTGPFGTQLHASDYVATGTPVINVRNIGFGDIKEEKLEFISPKTVKRLASHLLEPGDIVFGRKGAVERHAFIKDKHKNWFQGSDCLRLRLKSSGIDNRFVSYYLLTENHKSWMISHCSHGSTMTSLNQEIIGRISFNLPPLPTQRKIAAILSSYDDLIKNNTRRIAILEEMAQRIYQEWFVHFRYPGHESVPLVDSPLGPIPESWEVKKLGEVINFKNGKAIKINNSGKYPVYGSNGVIGYVNEYNYKNSIIIGRVGSCGAAYYCKSEFWASDNTIVAESQGSILTTELIYKVLKNLDLKNYAGGSAQPLLTQTTIKEIQIVIPSNELILQYQELASNLTNFRINLTSKNENLHRTRDLLLPRLISGELDVEELDIKTATEAELVAV